MPLSLAIVSRFLSNMCMATRGTPSVPMGDGRGKRPRNSVAPLAHARRDVQICRPFEAGLADAEFDRGPWLAVAFGGGIGLWFLLAIAVAMVRHDLCWSGRSRRTGRVARSGPQLCAIPRSCCRHVARHIDWQSVWARSAIDRYPADRAHPTFERIDARILEREDQPAAGGSKVGRSRCRDGTRVAYRVNVPLEQQDQPGCAKGAGPAVGAAYAAITADRAGACVPRAGPGSMPCSHRQRGRRGRTRRGRRGRRFLDGAAIQRKLSAHVRERLDGAPGAIAATLASGDRGAIPKPTR